MVTNVFYMFADLIAFHLDAIEKLDKSKQALIQQRAFNETLEQKILERTAEIEESYAQLEKMNKELQSFAYISSHDLQEPLRKIQTFASIIEEKEIGNLSDTGKEYFKRMRHAAERMQILISDLLTYSRASIDEKQFEMTDLGQIVQQVKEDLREELLEKEASVVFGKSCEAKVITFQFRQLLYNLVSNAVKFSGKGQKPQIFIECKIASGATFGIRKLSDGVDYCHLMVSDNGIGFDQKYGEKIFELFQRLHDKTQYAGTGIGLAIVKKIVENHQGYITAESQLNKGATFNVYLPAL
jgi:light-regulated signal transduction histidine kinase (bacteriophytochrome)